MKRDLESILTNIRSDNGPQLLLLFGDELQVQAACKTLLDNLVPEGDRGFNLERFDGRSAPWEQIEASVNIPPFFAGKKVVWVENAPYFISREQKGELADKVLQAWSQGKKDEAATLLRDLLDLEGWTQEHWEQLQNVSSLGPLGELLEVDGTETHADAQALLSYCKSQGMDLTQRRGSKGHGLAQMFQQGLPPWGFLLLTAVQVDRRTRLYKQLEESGAALQLVIERDRSGRINRDSLAEFIRQRLREAGKTIEPRAGEMLLSRAGDELRSLQQELEKLVVYVADQKLIRTQDVDLIFADQAEGWIFDLTRAIAERETLAALAHLARLMAQGEHPLKLLGTIASEVRRLLAARQLIDGELRGRWKRGLSYQQFQQVVLKENATLPMRSPYADYMCFQRADHFSAAELRSHLERIYDADHRLKSSGQDARLVMERLILGMCLGSPNGRAFAKPRVAR